MNKRRNHRDQSFWEMADAMSLMQGKAPAAAAAYADALLDLRDERFSDPTLTSEEMKVTG